MDDLSLEEKVVAVAMGALIGLALVAAWLGWL